MTQKQIFLVILLSLFFVVNLNPDVPPAKVHQPDVPYFLQSMNFRTVQMQIFPERFSGMVEDPYSDLSWNPAFILRQPQNSLYLDFNAQSDPAYSSSTFYYGNHTYYNSYYYYYSVQPSWYRTTAIDSVDTTPIYQFAAIIPLSSKISIGLINRSMYDYGPFRLAKRYYYDSDILFLSASSSSSSSTPVLSVLESDENQQKVLGTQSEVTLGFKLSSRLDLGVRLGHFTFNRDGNLLDSEYGVYPHSSIDSLDDELFEVKGNHVDVGVGLLFKLGTKTCIGLFGAQTKGTSSEVIESIDNMDRWSERDSNPKYYTIHQSFLESSESFSSEGKKRRITVTLEHEFSKKLILRSFFSNDLMRIDTTGSTESSYAYHGDRTYDKWNWGPHFRREVNDADGEHELNGSGEKSLNHWRWFASMVFKPKGEWAVFGGILVEKYSYKNDVVENSLFRKNFKTQYHIYDPESYRYYTFRKMNYSFFSNYKKWSVSLPFGIKAKVYKGLRLFLGTDLTISSIDKDLEGNIVYPEKIYREFRDGEVFVDDVEIDRLEEYRSDPAKVLNVKVGHYFGLAYEFDFGGKLYLRSFGDVFDSANWALGFEMTW